MLLFWRKYTTFRYVCFYGKFKIVNVHTIQSKLWCNIKFIFNAYSFFLLVLFFWFCLSKKQNVSNYVCFFCHRLNNTHPNIGQKDIECENVMQERYSLCQLLIFPLSFRTWNRHQMIINTEKKSRKTKKFLFLVITCPFKIFDS